MRLEEAQRVGDATDGGAWTEATGVLAPADAPPPSALETDDSSEHWKIMQKVELCRHRAMKLERKAADLPEPLRQEAIDAAMQWRDLALQVLLFANLARG